MKTFLKTYLQRENEIMSDRDEKCKIIKNIAKNS